MESDEPTPVSSNTFQMTMPSQTGQFQRPVFMPETFTGAGREWADWSEQFEMAAEVNGWDETFKLKFMSLLLSGKARDIYSGLTPNDKANYQSLKAAMTKCLQPCDSDEWNRVNFTSRKRFPSETAREFGNALRRLVGKAYPSVDFARQDLSAKDQFITNIGRTDLRVQLRTAKM